MLDQVIKVDLNSGMACGTIISFRSLGWPAQPQPTESKPPATAAIGATNVVHRYCQNPGESDVRSVSIVAAHSIR